jgi:hypothetical protein
MTDVPSEPLIGKHQGTYLLRFKPWRTWPSMQRSKQLQFLWNGKRGAIETFVVVYGADDPESAHTSHPAWRIPSSASTPAMVGPAILFEEGLGGTLDLNKLFTPASRAKSTSSV